MKNKLIKGGVLFIVLFLTMGFDVALGAITIQAYNLGLDFVEIWLGAIVWLLAFILHALAFYLGVKFWQEC